MQGPESFAQLARDYSEDPLTREAGGRLGYLPAMELSYWPTVLDCLAGLNTGEMTPVVETEFGFHVFGLDPIPQEQEYSARRIVIGYDGADFLRYSARPKTGSYTPTRRSKAEARALAERLAGESSPETFESLVLRHSDHCDAARGGDLGVWSSREPTHFPRLVDAILAVEVGKTTAPVDSELGYQVLLRTPAAARPRYAVRATYFAFDPAAGAGPSSQDAARGRAEARLKTLRQADGADGDRGLVTTFTAGRGPLGLEEAIAEVEIDEYVPRPILVDQAWVVAKRVALPDDEPLQMLLNRLPAPVRPDLAEFVATSPDAVAQLLADVTDTMPSGERRVCRRLHRKLLRELSQGGDAASRRAAWAHHEAEAAGIWGAAIWREYRRSVEAWVESRQLQHVSSSVVGAMGG